MSPRILIVDDDPVVRLLMEECLSAHGFEVHSLPGGHECLEHLSTHSTDLVVLDMLMPDMSGVDVLKELRRTPSLANVPVLMLSALNDADQILEKESECRPDGVLQKPFNLNAVLEAVRSVQPKER